MDIPTILVLMVVLLMAGAYIAQPLIAGNVGPAGQRRKQSTGSLRRRADLLAERNRIYAALRDLDFDYQTGKVADEDYAAQRRPLVTQGVEVLQQIDHLPALEESPQADPIEAAVLSARSAGVPAPAGKRPASKKKKQAR